MKSKFQEAKDEALQEVANEEKDKMKHTYKNKLKELAGAKRVVLNLERELEALDDKFEAKSTK
jgi:hypothetical protein